MAYWISLVDPKKSNNAFGYVFHLSSEDVLKALYHIELAFLAYVIEKLKLLSLTLLISGGV